MLLAEVAQFEYRDWPAPSEPIPLMEGGYISGDPALLH
jgi:hypothetical protein